jgi:hypothetical protein
MSSIGGITGEGVAERLMRKKLLSENKIKMA